MAIGVAVCTTCQGTKKCPRCGGSGERGANLPSPSVKSEQSFDNTISRARRKCPDCLGSGTCQSCHGTGHA